MSDLPTREWIRTEVEGRNLQALLELSPLWQGVIDVLEAYADGRLVDRETIDTEPAVEYVRLLPGVDRWREAAPHEVVTRILELVLGGVDD